MKVDNLFAPYLYQHKKLFLPGIGLFTLDDKAILPDDTSKIKTPIEGITFIAKAGTQLDDSLIQYIKDETGKMKALAEADLYSFIATAFQFLNIGKPFYFEGIGTLQKNKDGAYNFASGTVIPQKTEEAPARYSDTSKKSTYNSGTDTGKASSFNAGKLLFVLGILVTLALIGWGGYYLYNKNTGPNGVNQSDIPAPVPDTLAAAPGGIDSTGIKPDSSAINRLKKDSAVALPSSKKDSAASPFGYKFVFETTGRKARALKRYEQLKDIPVLTNYNNKVAVETKDSLSFKIYTMVSCTPADTAHVKKLLNAWYYGKTAMKVKIEH
ncbi:MAG: hypothetical protein NVSMB7_10040 [Chitinophagaceae bacterium]